MKHDPFTDKKIKSKGLGLVLILALAGLWTGLNQGQCSGLKPNFIVILGDSPFQGEVQLKPGSSLSTGMNPERADLTSWRIGGGTVDVGIS